MFYMAPDTKRRVAVTSSLWAVMAFQIFTLVNDFPSLLSNAGKFTAAVAVVHRLLLSYYIIWEYPFSKFIDDI